MATPRCAGMSGARRRRAFSSWRSQPARLPRPAWYQATATCTRPWRKSRSAGSAARHASSSSSWAAKNSPSRISSSPRSRGSRPIPAREGSAGESFRDDFLDGDLDLAAFDLHLEGLQPDRVVELVLPGSHVVLPAVPGTAQHRTFEPPLRKRPVQVQASMLSCEEFAADVCDRNRLLVDLHGRDRPRWDVLHTRDVPELGPRHAGERSTLQKRYGVVTRSVTLVTWRRSCWRESTSTFAASSKDFFRVITSSRSTASTRLIS